ncbi:DUF2934 domain-containing protein [Skermanella mucosa]|uniref:DUF2934 domain-containing protein n=1 Tax=Skermanella mucosa TaxID=1789672 RepID=UPI00192AD91C|nr:DUF2934 domain-containing protein [Skermanella mucosa]UEM22771.1 DUF2934 domain-containing protein [Skermanella mucosa]
MDTDDREERVRQRAHEIWMREGRPEGRRDRHWQEAKDEIEVEEGGSLSAVGEEDPEPIAVPSFPARDAGNRRG